MQNLILTVIYFSALFVSKTYDREFVDYLQLLYIFKYYPWACRECCVCVQVWDRDTLECVQVLTGHTGSVLCLQYDENIVISGSSDSTVRCVCVCIIHGIV